MNSSPGRSFDAVSRRLKLRQLEILLAVAEWRSMAKAAKHLSITQPVVSKAIADLENTLGARLVDRNRRGIELTSYGEALTRRGAGVFNELRTGLEELESLSDPRIGHVRIGGSEAAAAGILGIIMERITRSHPQIRFEVKLLSGNTDRLYRDLQLRELDLVMSRIPEGAQREFKIDILYEDPMCVIAGVNSAWSRRKTVELSDIRDERWCLPSLSLPPWTKVADAFRSRGLDLPTSAVTTSSVPLLSKLVGSGQFLSILPYTVFHILANDLKARILPLDLNVKYPFGIATLLNRAISPSTALFIATARHVAGSMDAARSKLLAQLSKKASRIL